METSVGRRVAVELASGNYMPGLDAWRAVLIVGMLLGGLAGVGFGIRWMEVVAGMSIEATLPLAGFLLASRLSARGDGDPRVGYALWKAYVRLVPVLWMGVLMTMGLSLKAGRPFGGGAWYSFFCNSLLGSDRSAFAWGWPVAATWWAYVTICLVSLVLWWLPWGRVGHRNVWAAGWLLVVVVPLVREWFRQKSQLAVADFIHGSVWRLDSVAWGVCIYGLLRRVPWAAARLTSPLASLLGGFGAIGVAWLTVRLQGQPGHPALLAVIQVASPLSMALVLPWLLAWKVPLGERMSSYLGLTARFAYPFFMFFIVVFQAGGSIGPEWIGESALHKSALAAVVSIALAWPVAVLIQPGLNRILLGPPRRLHPLE